MTDTVLPGGFEALAPYLDWNLATADERQARRRTSSAEDLRAFYDGVLPHLEAMLEEVDRFPLGRLPESHRAIYNIALAVAEVAPHLELYHGDPAVPFSFEEPRMIAGHGGQETWRGKRPLAGD